MGVTVIWWLAVAAYAIGFIGMMRYVVCEWVADNYADQCRKYPQRKAANRRESLCDPGAWWMGAMCGMWWPVILICIVVWKPTKLVGSIFGRWFLRPATKRMAES